ncbi:MAG: PAS domain-containing protein [Nostoc sp.]|uniref:PAS domain-containing protein n=1 Tax=Nostoc sp. TaxID=1180 RepID=UPI002FF60E63
MYARVLWSAETFALYGLEPDGGLPDYEDWHNQYLHPDDRSWVSATVSQVIEEHLPNLEIEFRIIHPQLGIRWLQSLGSLTFDEQGEPVRLSGINLDISDRKQAELTLKQISERLQLVLEATKVGVYDWNATTNEVIWTPENEIMMGYEPGTPNRTYQEWADRVHPEDLARVELMLQTAIIQGQKDYH